MKRLYEYILCVAVALLSVFALNAVAGASCPGVDDTDAVYCEKQSGHVSPQGAIMPFEVRAAQFADLAPQIGMSSGVSLVRTVPTCGGPASPAAMQVRKAEGASPVVSFLYSGAGMLPSYGMSQSHYYIFALRRIRI